MSRKMLLVFILGILLIGSLYSVSAGQLQVTNEHPFLINGEWREAQDLTVGNEMTTIDGKRVRITGIEKIISEKEFPVYNLEAGVYHDFVVCGEEDCVGEGVGKGWFGRFKAGGLESLLNSIGVVVHNSNVPGSNYPCKGVYANCPLVPGKKYSPFVARSELIRGINPTLDEAKIATWITDSPNIPTRLAREKYVKLLREGKITFAQQERQLLRGLNTPGSGVNDLISDGKPYGVILGRDVEKSGNYVYQMAKPHLKKAPSLETYLRSPTLDHPQGIIRDAIENQGVRRFVIFDDVSYTGTELNGYFVRPFNSIDYIDEPIELILDVPYMTDKAKRSILESVTNPNLRVKFAPHGKIKNAGELFTREERALLDIIDEEITLTFTDWKIPDGVSFDYQASKLFDERTLDVADDIIPYKVKGTTYNSQESILFEDTEKYLEKLDDPFKDDEFLRLFDLDLLMCFFI